MPTQAPCDTGRPSTATSSISHRWANWWSLPLAGRELPCACMARPDITRPRISPSRAPRVAARTPAGLPQPGREIVLHHGEGAGIERLLAQRVGQDPVGAGHQLADQVAVAPGGHDRRRRGDDVEVGHDRHGRGTGEGALEAAFAQRRARGGIAVHRRRGRHADIGRAGQLGGVFHQVVDDARADRRSATPALRRSAAASSRAVSALAFTRGFSLSTIGSAVARPAAASCCASPRAGHGPGVVVGHDHVARRRRRAAQHRRQQAQGCPAAIDDVARGRGGRRARESWRSSPSIAKAYAIRRTFVYDTIQMFSGL